MNAINSSRIAVDESIIDLVNGGMIDMNRIDSDNGNKQRRSIRLPDYDCGQVGAYFVTVVTHQRRCVLGDVVDEVVWLSEIGRIVESVWREIPVHFPNVSVNEYVVMPNHVHGIIQIKADAVRAQYMAPIRNRNIQESSQASLGVIIGTFKAAVSRAVHKIKGQESIRLWHRNYYEHVIRDECDYKRVVDYIRSNPLNWERDSEYPFGYYRINYQFPIPQSFFPSMVKFS